MATMYCRQCEQAALGSGCTVTGICGKTPETSGLQDLLVHVLKGIAFYGTRAREMGIRLKEADLFIIEGLFTTVTNVNFDSPRIAGMVQNAQAIKERLKQAFEEAYEKKHGRQFMDPLPAAAAFKAAGSIPDLLQQAGSPGVLADKDSGEDIRSLREILLYGMKGTAAYADHARILGKEDETVNAFFYTGLAALDDHSLSAQGLIALVLECGRVNLRCMELLDRGHTERFGDPVPTPVALGVKKGPAIIVSGHDLEDLRQLLEQAEGTGVNVYTHGEMLPAHGYPGLKKYAHLAGHFGTAWQNQQKEFDGVPAAFLFTTNCIQKPRESYSDRIFTTGLVGWPGVAHIPSREGKKDFSPVIRKAKELGGFKAEEVRKETLVGFAHKAILAHAPAIIEAVKAKKIRHFFLIGGCDGAKPGRNYFTEFAVKVPKDCLILTLACGKFRFNDLEFGSVAGFPRLLDCGQCNDAYSAIKVAAALAEAFGCGVNELPLSMILSWYEQKAVCILLTLLSLGVTNIRLGPSLPAFVSPGVLKTLVDTFNIMPITNPDDDLKAILGAERVSG